MYGLEFFLLVYPVYVQRTWFYTLSMLNVGKTNTDLPRKKQSCGSRGAAKELLQSHWNNCHIIDFFRYLSDLGNGYENNKKKSIQIAGAYPSHHWARGGVHPGQLSSPSQGHSETNEHAHAHILETPFNLTCMLSDGGRKPENRRTHAYTGRTCKRQSWELNLEPSRCEATVLTTTSPCSTLFTVVLKKKKKNAEKKL